MKRFNSIFLKSSLFLFMMLGAIACDDLLEAENPNNLVVDDLSDPRAFGPMVNGLETSVLRAYGNILAPYSTASDEMTWSGSRDAWQQLNFGNIGNSQNEFTDAAFFYVGEARWWSDEVIKRGEAFQADGASISDADLSRAYIYGAFTYIFIADMFDDFVITSDKLEAGMPVGAASMGTLYDVAIGYLNKAVATGQGVTEAQGLLARAQYSKALWAKVNPVNTASPLVNDAAASSAAGAAIGAMGGVMADYAFSLVTSSGATGTVGGLDIAGEVNQRNEMQLSTEYVIQAGNKVANISDGDPATTISLMDPIDMIPDPALYKYVSEFTIGGQFPSYPITTSREMHLILAEAGLAAADMAEFTLHINHVRAMDGLTPYSGQMDATDLLEHSRRVNLFLQGRRIADHYRFGSPSVFWIANTDATSSPGTFFPITISEIQSNPNVN